MLHSTRHNSPEEQLRQSFPQRTFLKCHTIVPRTHFMMQLILNDAEDVCFLHGLETCCFRYRVFKECLRRRVDRFACMIITASRQERGVRWSLCVCSHCLRELGSTKRFSSPAPFGPWPKIDWHFRRKPRNQLPVSEIFSPGTAL